MYSQFDLPVVPHCLPLMIHMPPTMTLERPYLPCRRGSVDRMSPEDPFDFVLVGEDLGRYHSLQQGRVLAFGTGTESERREPFDPRRP